MHRLLAAAGFAGAVVTLHGCGTAGTGATTQTTTTATTTTTHITTTTTTTIAPLICPMPGTTPKAPANILDYNGIAWPSKCFNDTEEQHFFVIGDWGGTFPHNTFTGACGRPQNPAVDPNAQVLNSIAMLNRSAQVKPKFVLNVGDNIYPGGFAGQCNAAAGHFEPQSQAAIVFANTFEDVYKGTGLDGVEWWGTLGNHDFGGYIYSAAWDQMMYYTWHSDDSRWITPALYWERTVQYQGFSADFFFVDTNINDAKDPDVDPEHNICNRIHNTGGIHCGGTNITSPQACDDWFHAMWAEQQVWLNKQLDASTADWQIIVSHYPPTFDPAQVYWHEVFPKYGVDLYISGHTHWQQFYSNMPGFGETAFIVSGGGGGITSDIEPATDGNDDAYGFVDVMITKDQLDVKMFSHTMIERSHNIVKPRKRADELEPQIVV